MFKDYKKRKTYAQYESQRLGLIACIKDSSVPSILRRLYIKQLNDLPRNSSFVRIRNRCVATGRARGVYRFCRLSRIKVRQLASSGYILGLRKSSW